jgi:hypothetical protein
LDSAIATSRRSDIAQLKVSRTLGVLMSAENEMRDLGHRYPQKTENLRQGIAGGFGG